MIKKVLIVDDSFIARKILKKCLPENHRFELHEAADGLAGVDKYKEINPDITFMDLTMPVMGGIEALEKILEYNNNAIVIVCTADIQIQSITKVMEIGALSIVKKPPTKEGVQQALQQAEDKLENKV